MLCTAFFSLATSFVDSFSQQNVHGAIYYLNFFNVFNFMYTTTCTAYFSFSRLIGFWAVFPSNSSYKHLSQYTDITLPSAPDPLVLLV